MTIRELQKFGALRKVNRGKGKIQLSDGSEYPIRFTFAQKTDGQLLLSGDINKSIWDFYTDEIEVQNLTGILQDGRHANFPGAINIKSVRPVPHSDKVRLVVYPSNCICGEKSFIGPASITFDLVNFCFVGTEFDIIKEDGRERGIRSLMSLTLGNRNIILKQIPDYEQVEATLITQRNVEVTCTATTPTSNYNELDDLISTMEYLCDVMSVARATLVNWVSFEVVTSDGMPIYAHYRNSVTGRYSGFALIDRNDPQQTKNFLENGYLKCNELEKDFQIKKISRAYTETRVGPFIETRSLMIAVLVEYMAGVQARLDKRISFMDDATFSAGWTSLKDKFQELLTTTYFTANKTHLRVMVNNIKDSLNRRPFSWQINNLAKRIDVKFKSGEVEKFVSTRNKLAHEGNFPEDGTPAQHYMRMQHFLDRIILRLFDYHGSYFDFEHQIHQQI